jgi:hypothetical protein
MPMPHLKLSQWAQEQKPSFSLLVVEFVNEREQAGLSGIDVAAQFGNLLAELLRI